MYGFRVALHGMTASFREPSSHLYQRTFPLPPISAMVGLAGAAMGMAFQDAWLFFKENLVAVGVRGAAGGRGIDLWGYRKVVTPNKTEKNAARKIGLAKIVRRDILNREFLAYPMFDICFASPRDDVSGSLRAAFADPHYALSLGGSDDIAMVHSLSDISELKRSRGDLSINSGSVMIEGNWIDKIAFDWEAIKRSGVAKTLSPPIARRLAVDFRFDGEERRGLRYELFTVLSDGQRLAEPVEFFAIGEKGGKGEKKFPLYFIS
jgi:CRISPR-associated protein Cas5t